MKILFTGGGTGGHFYPIIAIAEAVRSLAKEEHLEDPLLYFVSDNPIDAAVLSQLDITYIEVIAGKKRTYAALQNITDILKTFVGVFSALWKLFSIYPDVVFGKGGYASFPVLFAARILRIPVVIHESDSVPGRVNAWAGKFAQYVAVSYPEAAGTFSNASQVVHTGQPVRKVLLEPVDIDVYENFSLPKEKPILLVLGGSQGSQAMNDVLLDSLPQLLNECIVVHQVGDAHLDWVRLRASTELLHHQNAGHYLPYGFIDAQTLRAFGSVASLVISRAGSTIFEISMWGKPSILIPLPIAHGDHQRVNAYGYARNGAALVLEQANLKMSIFSTTVTTLLHDHKRLSEMSHSAKEFFIPDAPEKIAKALLSIASAHNS